MPIVESNYAIDNELRNAIVDARIADFDEGRLLSRLCLELAKAEVAKERIDDNPFALFFGERGAIVDRT